MALTNVETALLQLIGEKKAASGYELDDLIEKRGYRNWAGIGKTSIYNTLHKLLKKGFIKISDFRKTSGKGPAPKKYSMTMEGFKTLKKETLTALSGSARGGNSFELAIASIPAAGFKKSSEALKQRVKVLERSLKGLESVFKKQGGDRMPVFVKALFERPMKMIEADREYTQELAEELGKYGR
jgi:DNA-binding PadR family transcriptional regulator